MVKYVKLLIFNGFIPVFTCFDSKISPLSLKINRFLVKLEQLKNTILDLNDVDTPKI